jgi:hypothetical protein
MSFEDDFRSTLHSHAGDLDLRGRGATEVMHLARRRQHRVRRAGAVAAVSVLGVGAVGVLSVRDRADDATIASETESGLTPLGPLDLSWQATDDGLSGLTGGPIFTEDASGVIYALSTAPGSQYAADGTPPEPMLYRLAEDGSWQPAGGGGAAPRLTDLASDGTLLYSLSTAPGTGGAGFDTHLSSSDDGGQTWTDASVLAVQPPSAAVDWTAHSTMQIDSSPFGAAIAVISTGFSPPWSLATDAATAEGISMDGVGLETTDAGVDVVRHDVEAPAPEAREKDPWGAEAVTPGSTAPPTTGPAPVAGPDGGLPEAPEPTRPASTVLRSYTWAELGVTGPEALRATATVLVREADAWVQVDGSGLAGMSIERVDVIGPDYVVRGTVYDGTDRMAPPTVRTMASSDGRSWRVVAADIARGWGSRIVGVGTAWVDAGIDDGSGVPPMQVSVDRGATWQTFDLGSVDGRLAGGQVVGIDGGPLGLAAVVQGDAGETGYLITTRDLVEWTVTPMAELSGQFATSAGVGPSVVVGADRIVVTATVPQHEYVEGRIAPSVTLIGTPIR